ncbi:hypothetical protein Vafri_19672 [Volvox africanus]|nr:hypothetical protein Vafri_19672 [Volvox africanus]
MLYDRMVMDDQVNKQILDFLETHVPSGEAEWAVYDATLAKFRSLEEEHLATEEAEARSAACGHIHIVDVRPLLINTPYNTTDHVYVSASLCCFIYVAFNAALYVTPHCPAC